MDGRVITELKATFDKLTSTVPDLDIEFWFARHLDDLLGYARWQHFVNAIGRAVVSLNTAQVSVDDHIRGVTKMIDIGSSSEREIDDFMLSRYACYVIAQNGNSRNEPIVFAQSYFALQTRKQELLTERIKLNERLAAHEHPRNADKEPSMNVFEGSVDNSGFGRIGTRGDGALFGGALTAAMKGRYAIVKSGPLASFLPALPIADRNPTTGKTSHNASAQGMKGE